MTYLCVDMSQGLSEQGLCRGNVYESLYGRAAEDVDYTLGTLLFHIYLYLRILSKRFSVTPTICVLNSGEASVRRMYHRKKIDRPFISSVLNVTGDA